MHFVSRVSNASPASTSSAPNLSHLSISAHQEEDKSMSWLASGDASANYSEERTKRLVYICQHSDSTLHPL